MPGKTLQVEAIVLTREMAGENHLRLALLEPESGRIDAYFRQSKSAKGFCPDLFDRGDFHLETSQSGSGYFIREFRLISRQAGIANSYESLKQAAIWARFLERNALHCHDPTTVFDIALKTFSAMEATDHATAALLKGLYLFARQEGWPVKEHWLRSLGNQEQEQAAIILNTPLDALNYSPQALPQLCQSLKNWLAAKDEVEL